MEIGSDTRIDDFRSISFHAGMGFRETDRQVVSLKKIRKEPTKECRRRNEPRLTRSVSI